jgi:hypothetical protein
MNTRDYRYMNRVKSDDPLPAGNPFTITCRGLSPGTSYFVRVYFKTADGSLIFGPSKNTQTSAGIKWTSEDWTISQTSIAARFELAGSGSVTGTNVVFRFGTSASNLQTVNCSLLGNNKYVTDPVEALSPNTAYIAQAEATIGGERQIITKQVKTLPDYSSVTVDPTVQGVGHTIRWDAAKVLHRISPEGLQTEYPRIVRAGGDTLLCSYHGGSGSDHWVNIYLQKSFDNGQTWTSPVRLLDKENSTMGTYYWRFTNPEMTRLQNGWIILSFTANGKPETNENCHVMVMISKDRGETWGDPVIVGRGRTWEPMIIQLPNG